MLLKIKCHFVFLLSDWFTSWSTCAGSQVNSKTFIDWSRCTNRWCGCAQLPKVQSLFNILKHSFLHSSIFLFKFIQIKGELFKLDTWRNWHLFTSSLRKAVCFVALPPRLLLGQQLQSSGQKTHWYPAWYCSNLAWNEYTDCADVSLFYLVFSSSRFFRISSLKRRTNSPTSWQNAHKIEILPAKINTSEKGLVQD